MTSACACLNHSMARLRQDLFSRIYAYVGVKAMQCDSAQIGWLVCFLFCHGESRAVGAVADANDM